MATDSIQTRIRNRLRTLERLTRELESLLETVDDDEVHVNKVIVASIYEDINDYNGIKPRLLSGIRQIKYWEAKKGGRPKVTNGSRGYKRGRYG